MVPNTLGVRFGLQLRARSTVKGAEGKTHLESSMYGLTPISFMIGVKAG